MCVVLICENVVYLSPFIDISEGPAQRSEVLVEDVEPMGTNLLEGIDSRPENLQTHKDIR